MDATEVNELYKSTAKGAVFNYLASNLGIVLQFLVTLVLIKFLSVSEFGVYSLFFSTVTFLGIFSGLAYYAIARFVPDYMANKNHRSAQQLFWRGLQLTFANGFLVFLALLLFPDAFSQFFRSQDFKALDVLLFALINLLQLVTGTFDWTLNALLKQKARALMRLAYTGLTLLACFLLLSNGIWLFGSALSTVLSVLLAASLLTALIGFLSVHKSLLRLPPLGTPLSDFRRLGRYGFFSQLNYLGELVTNLTIDNLLIGYFVGTTAIAWYSFGVKMPQVLMAYSPAVVSALVLFPSIVKKFSASRNYNDLRYFFEAYTRFTAFFIFPTVLGLSLLAAPAIEYVFDPKYLVALNVFLVATFAHGFLAFRHALVSIYNTLERPEIGFYSKVIFVFTIAANALLLQAGEGILMVALVNAAGFALMTLAEFYFTRRLIQLRVPWTDLFLVFAASLAMAAFVLLGKGGVNSLGGLLLLVLLSAGVYAVCCLALKPFTRQDGQLFARIGLIGRLLGAFARK